MRFITGIAWAVCGSISTAQALYIAVPTRLEGTPIVSEIQKLRCPNMYRLDIFIASLKLAGWKQQSWRAHVSNHQQVFQVVWHHAWQGSLESVHYVDRGTLCVQSHTP